MKTKIIGRYDEHLVVGLDCSKDEKLTKDSFADDCDINKLVERYARTGILPGARGPGQYVDVSNLPSYHEAMETVVKAQEAFYALDPEIRLECGNDPGTFIEKLKRDPEWGIKHGLLERVAESEAKAAPLASQAAKAAEPASKEAKASDK